MKLSLATAGTFKNEPTFMRRAVRTQKRGCSRPFTAALAPHSLARCSSLKKWSRVKACRLCCDNMAARPAPPAPGRSARCTLAQTLRGRDKDYTLHIKCQKKVTP